MLNLVIGLGKTGLSCVKFCLEHGLAVAVTDSRVHPPEEEALKIIAPEIQTAFGGFSEKLIQQAATLIVSPGVSLREPLIEKAIKAGKPYIGDIGLFMQVAMAPVVAVTGSNAKSTVVTLVGEMAKAAGIKVAVGGNLGEPALELLKIPNVQLFVLELSSFQLETTHALRTQVASILNITEDHMDRYANFSDYVNAKQRIYRHCETAVFNRADQNTLPRELVVHQTSFGLDKPLADNFGVVEQAGDRYLARGEKTFLKVTELGLKGEHNISNSLAALGLALAAGIPETAAISTLKQFKGLPHRCQFVRERHDVTWINDSKGTNVGATVASLLGFGQQKNIILIAGGDGKNADFSPLIIPVKQSVRHAVLFGKDADQIEKTLTRVCHVHRVINLREAVKLSDQLSKKGDIVLLSPACSSLDMFKNFEYRGKDFIDLVEKL